MPSRPSEGPNAILDVGGTSLQIARVRHAGPSRARMPRGPRRALPEGADAKQPFLTALSPPWKIFLGFVMFILNDLQNWSDFGIDKRCAVCYNYM